MGNKPVTGNSDFIRKLNRAVVLDIIRRHSPVSRAEVKRATGLNFTTVTNAVNDLVGAGLVREVGLGDSNGGRRPVLLTLNPGGRYVIGCELQSTSLVVALFDLTGRMIACRAEAKSPSATPREVVARIASCARTILAEGNVAAERVEGVGVAAPGPLDTQTGVLHLPPNLPGWRDVPLRRLLQDALGFPVTVEKDGNAAALGEVWFGAAQGVRNLVFIIVDAGIGAGIICAGRLYRGRQDGAGEIGHTTLDLDGPRCSCGNYGCFEALASGFTLSRKAGEAIRRGARTILAASGGDGGVELATILAAARSGDKLALDLLDECGRLVGIAVANVVNMYNPEVIVLGGRLAREDLPVLARAQELGRSRAFPVLAERVRIVPSALGERFLVAGAAALILAQLFRSPVELAGEEPGRGGETGVGSS